MIDRLIPRLDRRAPLSRFAWPALGLLTLVTAARSVARLAKAHELARLSVPFQSSPPEPRLRVLVVGDSTAVGTGASSPSRSVPGLLAQAYPGWSIVNRACDGARFADVERQLAAEATGTRHDMVLVLAGGNDVIRLTGRRALHEAVTRTVRRARRLARRVIVMPAGNVGNAPFFWPPLSWWMSARARMLHAVVRDVVAGAGEGVLYVSLFAERQEDPFAQQPERMNAPDGLHPSDAGYRLWFDTLRAQAGWTEESVDAFLLPEPAVRSGR